MTDTTPTGTGDLIDVDRLLKDALFASIEPHHSSPLYCGVAVSPMTQACAAVFYVPRDWSRDQIKAWLANPQAFPPAAQDGEAERLREERDALRADLDSMSDMLRQSVENNTALRADKAKLKGLVETLAGYLIAALDAGLGGVDTITRIYDRAALAEYTRFREGKE